MRIFRTLLKYRKPVWQTARAPQNPKKVPFDPILPITLRNRVSGKSDRVAQVECLHELSVLFAKLKETDFDDRKCTKEYEALKIAHLQAMKNSYEEKLKNRGEIKSTGKNLNPRQLNKYMKKYPQELDG